MAENMQELKNNLKRVLMEPGDPNGEWVDAGEICRQYNQQISSEINITLPHWAWQEIDEIASNDQSDRAGVIQDFIGASLNQRNQEMEMY